MTKPTQSAVDCLRSLVSNPRFEELADSELLRHFIETHSDDAFASLLFRHGPMVMGLARRIVRDHQLAEDIFQATFLMLDRQARAIRGRKSLAAWLHSVAFRLAVRAKKTKRRFGECATRALRFAGPDPLDELTAREFLMILDEELNNLPEKYRLPLILCHLEGLTRDEAAKRLGLSVPSVKARLERGRERLRLRLTRRGLAWGAAVASTLQFGPTALAVPPALVQVTLRAALTGKGASLGAAALTNGAIKMMFLAKVQRICLAVVLLGVVGGGAGWLAQAGPNAQQEKSPPALAPPIAKEEPTGQANEKSVDLYGDPLPEGAVMRFGTVHLRAAGAKLALSPDGKTLFGVRGGRFLSFWDVASGKLKETRAFSAAALYNSIFSADGRWLATGNLEILDVRTGKRSHKLDLKGEHGFVGIAFSPDGNSVAAVANKHPRFSILAWDLTTGKETFRKEITSNGSCEFVGFTPDGKKLLASFRFSESGTYCWDRASGQQLWQNKKHANLTPLPVFSVDGTRLLSSSPPLDVATGNALPTMNLPPLGWGNHIIVAPDGRTLLVADADGVQVWDIAKAKQVRMLAGAGEEMLLAPDGKTLITNNGSLQSWDLSTGKPLYPDNFDQGHCQEVTALIFSKDGKKLASAAADGSVRLWDVTTARPIHVWRGHESFRPVGLVHWHNAGVKALDMTPDGRWIISAGSEATVRVWDAGTGERACSFPLPPLGQGQSEPLVYQLRISADGKKAMGMYGPQAGWFVDGQVIQITNWLASWDLPKGTLLAKCPVENAGVNSYLSQDGKSLFGFGSVVNLDTKEIIRFDGAGHGTMSRDGIAPDVSLIAGDCGVEKEEKGGRIIYPGGVRLWEMATGKSILHLKTKSWNSQLAFHPNLRYLAVDDFEAIQVWDVITGKVVSTLKIPKGHTSSTTHGSYASCLAFSPDGRRLATGHPDGTILLWNINLPAAQTVRLAPKDVDALWAELKDGDAAKAWRAVWRLADSPDEVVPFLRKQLKPVAPAPQEITRPLLADLSSEFFAKRESAKKRLQELGLLAESALRAMLKDNPPLETQRRVEALLKTIVETPQPLTPEMLRSLRAVAVLARIKSPEARVILEGLTKGVESARLTCAANAALDR